MGQGIRVLQVTGGWDIYGRQEKRAGIESGILKVMTTMRNRKFFAALHDIMQKKKHKEVGDVEVGVGTGS